MAREKRSTAKYDKSYTEEAQDEQPVASGSKQPAKRLAQADSDFDHDDEGALRITSWILKRAELTSCCR